MGMPARNTVCLWYDGGAEDARELRVGAVAAEVQSLAGEGAPGQAAILAEDHHAVIADRDRHQAAIRHHRDRLVEPVTRVRREGLGPAFALGCARAGRVTRSA